MPPETGRPPGSKYRGGQLRMKELFCIIGLFLSLSVQAEEVIGRVVGITDGDTLTVLDASHQQHKIRLMGIDAPERKQPFGERARQNLAHLAFAQEVSVQWRKKHRNRLIGKVLVNGVDVSLEQIRSGMAWWYEAYRKDQTERDRNLYSAHEADARQSRIGLWQDPAPVAPWDWRRRRK